MRSRRGSSSDSDDESVSSGRSTSSTRTSSKAALRDTHWSIQLMRYVTGAPSGPVAIKKVTTREVHEWGGREYHNGHYENVSHQSHNDYYTYYYVPIKFDDSISIIDEKRQRSASRQSSSSKSSRRQKASRAERERPRPRPQRFEPPPQQHFEPQFDDGSSYDEESLYGDEDAYFDGPPAGNFHAPPMAPMGMQPGPPPPPPPNAVPAFFDLTGQNVKRKEGW